MNDWYDNTIWEMLKEEENEFEEAYRIGFKEIKNKTQEDFSYLDLWERGLISTETFLQRLEID